MGIEAIEAANACPTTGHPHNAGPRPRPVLRVVSSSSDAAIDEFLTRLLPSTTTDAMVSWISVVNLEFPDAPEGDIDSMIHEWRLECRSGNANPAVLHELGRKYNVLSGKWMIFPKREDVDLVWRKIVYAVARGQLGPSAKVSPTPTRENRDDHVICVYAANFLDEDDVRRIRQGLRALGHNEQLFFKPDVYTDCGVYTKNPWNIPAHSFAE